MRKTSNSVSPEVIRKVLPGAGAVVSGLLLSLAYPRWNIEGFAWVWTIPLLWALWFGRTGDFPDAPWRRARYGAFLGFLSGSAFFLVNLSWLHTVSSLGAILLPLYLALYFAAWGAFAATAGRPRERHLCVAGRSSRESPAAAPARPPSPGGNLFASSFNGLRFAFLNAAAWTATEWLRGILFTGFGWNGLGVALHENLMLIQIADVVGVTGLSFMLMFCGCIATTTIRRIHLEFGSGALRPHLDFAATVAAVILVFFYGLREANRDPGESLPVRTIFVQLNVPVDLKWDPEYGAEVYRQYDELTSLYVETGDFDLVLWPETALQQQFFDPRTQAYLDYIMSKGDFNLVLGIEEGFPPGEFYNSVALLRGSTRDHELYRKIHLVPFGEYIPLRKTFPPFEWVAGRLVPLDFTAGETTRPLQVENPEFEIIPLVCFEDTLGDLVRRFVTTNPQLIVNVTNDGWFLQSQAAEQHLANARFRCVELRRPMARAANTGVSAYIDPLGSLFDRNQPAAGPRTVHDEETGSIFVAGCRSETIRVPVNPRITFYARFGDLFSKSMLGVTVVVVTVSGVRRRKKIPAE